MTIAFALLLLATNPPSQGELANFIVGMERTPQIVNGKPVTRVEKIEGHVVRLQLDGMQLAPDDYRLIGSIATLRRLSLNRTNTTDKDLAQLRGLTHLESLALTGTKVTDASLKTLLELKSLRSACLGNVAITPPSIARLKEDFPKLSLGYSQKP